MNLKVYCKVMPYSRIFRLEHTPCRHTIKKLLLFMKLTTVLLTVAFLQVSAAAHSQKITMNERNAPLEKVLQKFREQSGYMLLYNTEAVLVAKDVNVSLKNAEIGQALKAIFVGLPFTYEIWEKTILIKPFVVKPTESQADDVRGRVVDAQKKPLPGVTIKVKNGAAVTQTDADGRFVLRGVDPNSILVFSMLGFRQLELRAGSLSAEIELQEMVSHLEGVVVTGYGTQERRAVTGAIASVRGEDIENVPLQSFDKALQGRAAGVLVQTQTGVPGGAVRINIRGEGSIGAGTEPMYIVDGVQLNSDAPTSRTSTNALAYINPNDIESIEVLKDGAAAAIYGSQAANGVILVTTKKGKAGKTNLSVNFYQGISAPQKNMNVLSSQDAIAMRTESLVNANPTSNYAVMLAQALSELGINPDLSAEEISQLPTYDWQSAAFKNGTVRNIELGASGGTDKTTFYVSGAYNKHDGNVTGIDFEKGTARFRLGHQASPKLSFDAGINLSLVTQNGNTGSQGNTTGSASPQYTAIYMPPTVPIYNPDGSFNVYEGMPGTGFNPIQAATVDDNIVRHRSLVGNFSATYKILENLAFKSFYGIDYRFIRNDYYRDPRTPNGASVNGYLVDENIENINFTTNQTLNYNKVFNVNHSFTALVGAEYRSDVREFESAQGQGFPTYQFRTMQSAAEAVSVTGSWSGVRKLGFFGQANYDFKKKYFISAVARYDGSSRFGADNRMGFFPGLSAGWDIAQEDFIKDSPWIDQLKLRAGYGRTGNDQINNVSSRGFYQGGGSYNGQAGVNLQTIANTQLGWETNISTNIGLDYSIFNKRIYGAIEVFRRQSDNLILDRPIPYTSGFSSVNSNLGEVRNQGVELDLNTVNIRKGDFSWTSNFNIAFLENEVTELYDGLDYIANTIRLGSPLKIWYRARYAGVNSANGRPMWYDKNGNITYLLTAEDNVPTTKGWQSDYFGGFSNSFRYKGFELSALLHYDMGRYMANTQLQVMANVMNNPGRNSLQELYDRRWTTPGQVTTVPRLIAGGSEFNSSSQQTATTRFLEDASFIRLREVTMAYQFSPKLLQKVKLSKVRVYVTGVNLYTWTKWTGYDPEFAIGGSVENNQGIIPQTMSFTAGAQVGF